MNIAIVPARWGSVRVPNKNVRLLGGHPLMAWSIIAALESECFERVYVATDSSDYAGVANKYGATAYMRQPSPANECDYDWLEPMMRTLWLDGVQPSCTALVRPTSPFRDKNVVSTAFAEFKAHRAFTSLRALTPTTSAYKQWWLSGNHATPIMDDCLDWGPQPGHSMPSQALPQTWRQTAGLEILRTRVLWDYRNITGPDVLGFEILGGPAALDINTNEDLEYAEWILSSGRATMPPLSNKAFVSR